jgi:hypothetical protein
VAAALVLSEWTLARVVSGHSPSTALVWLAALALMIRATPGGPPQVAPPRAHAPGGGAYPSCFFHASFVWRTCARTAFTETTSSLPTF